MYIRKEKLKKMLEKAKTEGFYSAVDESEEYIKSEMEKMREDFVNSLSEIGSYVAKPSYLCFPVKPDNFGNYGVDVSSDFGQTDVRINI